MRGAAGRPTADARSRHPRCDDPGRGVLAGLGLLAAGVVWGGPAGCRPDGSTSSSATADPTADGGGPLVGVGVGVVGAAASATAESPNPPGMPSAMIAAVVNPMHLPAYSGPTGVVEGTVLVRGPDAPDVPNLDVRSCPAALDTYGKLFRAGPRRADGARPLADAIVVVTGYSGFYLPERSTAERVTIGARCGYPTRSIALTFGQRLEIANDSTLAFAPYLEGVPQLTVLVAPPQQRGEPAKIFAPRSDYYVLRDQMQKFVRGDVYVLRQPLHSVSDIDGRFRIEGVPAGKLAIGAQLAALPGQATKDVDVRANVVQEVEMVLTYAPQDGGAPRAPERSPRPAR
jgi:hypothetical protein